MARKATAFTIVYDVNVIGHLDAIELRHHALIHEAIEAQLTYQPEAETRNRKPLRRPSPFGATWEIRFGPENRFRVFYKVDSDRREVQIIAIGVKEREQLWVGGKEVTT